jgi:hypothetical protein
MADMKSLRAALNSMGSDLFIAIDIPFEETSELQRQLLGAFAFGMSFAIGQIEKLTPPEVHALAIALLMDAFRYSDHQATAFAHDLIESASGRGNSTTRAVIHRGIDGHRQWNSGDHAGLRDNIESIFSALGA